MVGMTKAREGVEKVRAGVLGAVPLQVPLQVIEGGVPSSGPPDGEGAVSRAEGVGGRGRGGGHRREDQADDPSPVTPLGHDRGGNFYFLGASGLVRVLASREMVSRGGVSGLFLGGKDWLKRRFPKKIRVPAKDESGQVVTDADGKPVVEDVVVDYRVVDAGEWLMAECHRAGVFDARRPIRLPGIWPGDHGLPAVHCGDWVLLGADWQKAGFKDPSSGVVWATAPMENPPCPRDRETGRPKPPGQSAVAGPEIAQALQEDIRQLWSVSVPGGEIVALGWVGAAYFGAATSWRPNIFLTGGAGSGKSLLLALLRACCPMNIFSTDASKAGIEGSLNGMAMPALIDETADRNDGRGAMTLVDVVLSASSGAGTSVLRGTETGGARKVELVTSVAMAAINAPPLQPQHRARFSVVELVKPVGGADHKAAMLAAIERAQAAGTALWLRALRGWDRFRAALDVYRAALGAYGCAAREMDQFGALLAGWWVLTEDGVPSAALGGVGVAALSGLVRRAAEVDAEDGPRQCVQWLASTLVQQDRSTDQESIGALVERAWDRRGMGDPQEAAIRWLSRNGIRVIRADHTVDFAHRPIPREGAGRWAVARAVIASAQDDLRCGQGAA